MSIIIYVASSQKSRTGLFCYVKRHIRFDLPGLNLSQKQQLSLRHNGIYLSLFVLKLIYLLCTPHLRRNKEYLNKKNVRFFGNVRHLLTPTTYHLHISNMAARFDLAARLLQRTIHQVTFAHPCIAIDSEMVMCG